VLSKYETPRSLRGLVNGIWDRPEGDVVETGITDREPSKWPTDHKPFPPHFDHMVWKPAAARIDNVYLPAGYNDKTDELLEAMPKIPESEAALLYNLLAKIFVYDAAKRPTAEELLRHPWFHLDAQLD
jgi:serine/threonine-protein kinase SRPK3